LTVAVRANATAPELLTAIFAAVPLMVTRTLNAGRSYTGRLAGKTADFDEPTAPERETGPENKSLRNITHRTGGAAKQRRKKTGRESRGFNWKLF